MENLGFTLIHEHLLTKPPRILAEKDPLVLPYEDMVLNDVNKAVEEVRSFYKAGGKTIVEATPITYGRNITGLLKIAKRVPEVNIIASTGFYLAETFTNKFIKMNTQRLAKIMIKELTEGIEDTSCKAGVIKVAVGYFRIHPMEKKALEAAAIAHQMTGAPIQIHTTFGTMSIEIVDILKKLGVNPHKILLLHMDTNLDAWNMIKTLEKEVNISFDRMARVRRYISEEMKLKYFEKLINEGFQDQLMMSMDAGRRIYFKAYGGGPGLEYIPTVIIPRLRAMGIEEKTVEKIFIQNPSRFLSFTP